MPPFTSVLPPMTALHATDHISWNNSNDHLNTINKTTQIRSIQHSRVIVFQHGSRRHKENPKHGTKQKTSHYSSNSILALASLLRSTNLTLPGYLVVKPSLSATTVSYPSFSFPSSSSKANFSSIAHGSILPTLLQPVATTH